MRFQFETNRRATDNVPPVRTNVRLFIFSTIFLCVLTVIAVIVVSIVVPMNAAIIAMILGVTSPIMTALLGAALHGIGVGIDGKMSQLLDATAAKERLAGVMEGLAENPKVNIEKDPKPPTP